MQHHTTSFSGLHDTVIFTQHWLPDDPPRAAVIIAHGYAEHSGRYAHVARHLTGRSYAVYALDHRGHGQSGGPRVLVRRFDDYVTDLRTYFEQVRRTDNNCPIFVYGHSMGSLMGLLFAARYQDELAGLITTGTALRLAGMNRVTKPLVKLLSYLLPNPRLLRLTLANGISRDPAVVEAYVNDSLVYTGPARAGLIAAMGRAAEDCAQVLPALRLPYLVLHGEADPLTPVAGVDILRERCGSPDLTIKVYAGLYHEVHNEPEQDQVLQDITGWLDAHLPG